MIENFGKKINKMDQTIILNHCPKLRYNIPNNELLQSVSHLIQDDSKYEIF